MQMIARFSSYKHVNRDRLFFEGVYIAAINLCDAALAPLRRRPDIEVRYSLVLHTELQSVLQWEDSGLWRALAAGSQSTSLVTHSQFIDAALAQRSYPHAHAARREAHVT